MATWKKILTEADKAADAASGIANGETGLATGNAVYDYIVAQNFGSGSGDITSVVVSSDSGDVGAATGSANFTIAGGTNVTTAGSGSTLTVNATAVHLAAANQTLGDNRTINANGNDLIINPNGGSFEINDSSGFPSHAEFQVGSGEVVIHNLTYPASDGSNGQFLKTNGSGDLSFGTVSTSDVDVSVTNLETRLGQIDSNVTIGNGTSVGVTIAGNLTVNGTTTTVNSTQLTIDDKIITAASGGTNAATVGTAGLEIDTQNATQLPFMGFVDGAGLTEMVVKAEGNTTAFPIAIMEFGSTASTAPTGDSGGVGAFHYNTTDDALYIRTA